MKKILLILVAAAGLVLSASSASAQGSLHMNGGAIAYLPTVEANSPASSSGFGFPGGGLGYDYTMRLGKLFGVSAGADLTFYGKLNYPTSQEMWAEMYLHIPIRAKLYIPFSENFNLQIGVGPNPSIGLVGLTGNKNIKNTKELENIYSTRFKPFTCPVGLYVGTDILRHIRLYASFDANLGNRSKAGGGETVHFGVFQAGFGYIF